MDITIVDYNVEGKLNLACLKEREHNHHSEEFKEQFHANSFLNEFGTNAIPIRNRRDLQYYISIYYLYSRKKKGTEGKVTQATTGLII